MYQESSRRAQLCLSTAVTLALLSGAGDTRAQAFPPNVSLFTLSGRFGGDGSAGFVASSPRDRFFSLIRAAGDVNGDGIDDMIVGSAYASFLAPPDRAYVLFGVPRRGPDVFLESLEAVNGGDGSAGFVILGASAGDEAGRAVNGAGDVNGDGIDDVILGAPLASPGGRNGAGRTYVIYGRSEGFPVELHLADIEAGDASLGVVFNGILPGAQAGHAVDLLEDINGDGIDDLIIGAPEGSPGGRPQAGVSYVVFGRDGGFPAEFELSDLISVNGGDGSEGFLLPGIAGGDHSGQAVARGGDVNGDGLGDVLIGAPSAVPAVTDRGQTYVVYGRQMPFPSEFALADLLPANGGDGSQGAVLNGVGESGFSLAGADIDGDGFGELLIGAPKASLGDILDGAAFLLRGSPAGLPASVELPNLLTANGGDGSEGTVFFRDAFLFYAGISVARAGDVNGDELDDLMVGFDSYYLERVSGAYVIYGRTDQGLPAELNLRDLSEFGDVDGAFGFETTGADAFEVAGLGDVNADGIDDVAFGGPRSDAARPGFFGESFILYGQRELPDPLIVSTVVGADLRLAVCRNITSGQMTNIASPDVLTNSTVDCAAEGWEAASGDDALLVLRTQTVTPSLVGDVDGLTNMVITCRNETTGISRRRPLGDEGIWNCRAFGVAFDPGDLVTVQIRGTVAPVDLR